MYFYQFQKWIINVYIKRKFIVGMASKSMHFSSDYFFTPPLIFEAKYYYQLLVSSVVTVVFILKFRILVIVYSEISRIL